MALARGAHVADEVVPAPAHDDLHGAADARVVVAGQRTESFGRHHDQCERRY
jgi:hypothetical protein